MNKKRGFTLVELLAVILLLAIIIVFIVPNVLKLFNKSNNKLNSFQINQLKDAVELYIDDTCINPINNQYVCEFSTTTDINGNIVIANSSISLIEFLERGYIDTTSYFSGYLF